MITKLINSLIGALFQFCQIVIDGISTTLSLLVSFLPNSPFTFIESSEFASLIAQINFFIPIYEFVAIGQTWLVAVCFYYLYSVFARWVKAIE